MNLNFNDYDFDVRKPIQVYEARKNENGFPVIYTGFEVSGYMLDKQNPDLKFRFNYDPALDSVSIYGIDKDQNLISKVLYNSSAISDFLLHVKAAYIKDFSDILKCQTELYNNSLHNEGPSDMSLSDLQNLEKIISAAKKQLSLADNAFGPMKPMRAFENLKTPDIEDFTEER